MIAVLLCIDRFLSVLSSLKAFELCVLRLPYFGKSTGSSYRLKYPFVKYFTSTSFSRCKAFQFHELEEIIFTPYMRHLSRIIFMGIVTREEFSSSSVGSSPKHFLWFYTRSDISSSSNDPLLISLLISIWAAVMFIILHSLSNNELVVRINNTLGDQESQSWRENCGSTPQ